jgi:hypothetical protein
MRRGDRLDANVDAPKRCGVHVVVVDDDGLYVVGL